MPPFPESVVREFAPVWYFHEHEQFFPCSIEYLLVGATLKRHSDPAFSLAPLDQSVLAAHTGQWEGDADYYIDIDPARFTGDLANAPIYYAVQQFPDRVEISYVPLYANQGGQTARSLLPIRTFDCVVWTYGVHQGDIERVLVTLAADSAGAYAIQSVGYEAHGEVTTYGVGDVPLEGGRPVAHVAMNGHSHHNLLKQPAVLYDMKVPNVLAVTSVCSSGRRWTPSDFRLVGLDAAGEPINDQIWAKYDGRVGRAYSTLDNHTLTSATYLDLTNLMPFDWGYVVTVDAIARATGQYPPDVLHGDGPGGLALRGFIRQPG